MEDCWGELICRVPLEFLLPESPGVPWALSSVSLGL